MAPIGKPGSIVTYYPEETVFKTSTAAKFVIGTAVSIGFGAAWAAHGAYIVIGSTAASKAKWNIVESAAASTLVNIASDWAFNRTVYSKVHQYASWSDYYNTYMLKDVITRYNGYTTSNGEHVFLEPIEVEIRSATYYGELVRLNR